MLTHRARNKETESPVLEDVAPDNIPEKERAFDRKGRPIKGGMKVQVMSLNMTRKLWHDDICMYNIGDGFTVKDVGSGRVMDQNGFLYHASDVVIIN